MHLALFSLLAVSLSLAHVLPSSQDKAAPFPSDFRHFLPSIPDTTNNIELAARKALAPLPSDANAETWQLFGVRSPIEQEEWGFIAVCRHRGQNPDSAAQQQQDQAVFAVPPPGIEDSNIIWGSRWLNEVLEESKYHLVPLTTFTDLALLHRASAEAYLIYQTTKPRELWNWYDQFFRAMGVDVS
ncbi:MAG: hypothetical protein M1829_003029 [Trizodia sp. TS-e1964]|nr:MAG: hypothetical protein M1829_003029 [Trizodia sp. TS-e1964]